MQENKMGVMPVKKLLFNMSAPMMVSMVVQALYNIVDSIFVAKIEEEALTAVSLAFPVQTLMIALSTGTGVGVNALLSKSLGEGDRDKAGKAAKNGIFMSVVCYIVFMVIGLILVEPFYLSQTDDVKILTYGKQYLSVVCILSIGLFLQMIFERILQATGRTFYTMITQAVGAVINMIMDPLLIFGVGFFPEMGVYGAAVATVFGQTVACILAVIFNIKKNTDVSVSFRGFRPDIRIIGTIYKVGLPSIIMQSISSVMVYGMNKILLFVSTPTATAVFGVYFKLQSFVFMPIFGLNNGMIPIVAYNYGAGKRKRLIDTVKYATIVALIIMTLGTLIFETLPRILLGFFEASENMMQIGVPALRIIAIHFPIAAFCIILGSMFQALGNGIYTMITSLCRQLFVLLPVAYLLSLSGEVGYVWWAFPIAEIMSAACTIFFFIRIKKKVIDKIPDKD